MLSTGREWKKQFNLVMFFVFASDSSETGEIDFVPLFSFRLSIRMGILAKFH